MKRPAVVVIKNWSQFQHYKDRDPPWIKLYRDTLTSEPWMLGTDLSRLLQLASTLLAARYRNATPLNFEVWQKAAHLDCSEAEFSAAIEHLIEHDFLEIQEVEPSRKQSASSALATCNTQNGSLYSEESREEQRESREDARARATTDPDQAWNDFQQIRAAYPAGTYRDVTWLQAERAYRKLLDGEATHLELLEAVKGYAAQQRAAGKVGTQYILSPAKFFADGHWQGPFPLPADPETTQRTARLDASWNRVLSHAHAIGCPLQAHEHESPDAFETRVKLWERSQPAGLKAVS